MDNFEYLGKSHPFNLSHLQKNIVDWVVNGTGDAVVNAVAGSGKTATLKAISLYLEPGTGLFLAFNHHIAEELKSKLKNMSISTIHSLGMKSICRKFKNPEVDGSKYRKKLISILEKEDRGSPLNESFSEISKAFELSRLTMTELSDGPFEEMCSNYGIDFDYIEPGEAIPIIKEMMTWGEDLVKCKTIDFTDMVCLPTKLKLPVERYEWVLVDEAQDLNKAQRELVLSARRSSASKQGRMIFVGDRHQAIYGFAGASVTSIDEIKDSVNASEHPLSICYRCPKSHIELAKKIVPEIEPSDIAIEGVIKNVDRGLVQTQIKKGDLVLCRITAPLVELCFELIGAGIGAKIRGMDIGEKLVGIIKKMEKKKGFRFANLFKNLDDYLVDKIEKILKKNGEDYNDPEIKKHEDMVNAIKKITDLSKAKNVSSLCDHIISLFASEKANPVVWLSTVHRAKGLEAETVWILHGELLPLTKMARKPWQIDQEWNLRYVALTRSKSVLNFIV